MENIIFNELRYRGFSVGVGMVNTRRRDSSGSQVSSSLEVDFVANLGSRKYYIQSAYSMSEEEKVRQEKESLTCLDDSFKNIHCVLQNRTSS